MNVDVVIYLAKLNDSICEILDSENFLSEADIVDTKKFHDIWFNEIEFQVQQNYIEHSDPMLTDIQFEKCLTNSIALYHLDNLQAKGFVESIFDIDCMETKYRLTTLGKSIALT